MHAPALSTQVPTTPLFAASASEPIRFWFEVGDYDLFYADVTIVDGIRNLVLAHEHVAVLGPLNGIRSGISIGFDR